MFHNNTEKINTSTSSNTSYFGKDIFRVLRDRIENRSDSFIKDRFRTTHNTNDRFTDFLETEVAKFTRDDLVKIYQFISTIFEDELSKYFSTLIIILKLIDDSEISEKDFYVSIIKAQFTNYEIYAIFLHTILHSETSQFRILVDKYELVDNLDVNLLINQNIFVQYKQKQVRNKLLLLQ